MLIHQGTNLIETIRLILRRFEPGDEYEMYKNWASDIEVCRYLFWGPHKDIEITRKRIMDIIDYYNHSNYYNWTLYLKSLGEIIGSISVEVLNDTNEACEVGYCLGRKYWNQGIMTEALRAVMHYLFYEVGYRRIIAKHDVNNPASGTVMRKAGMSFDKYIYHPRGDGTTMQIAVYIKDVVQ